MGEGTPHGDLVAEGAGTRGQRPWLMPAWEAFHEATEARRTDLHDPEKAAALAAARRRLDAALAEVAARVPYRVHKAGDLRPGRGGGHVHLALREEIAIGDWTGRSGQTLCGAPAGRYAGERALSCTACIRLLDRHVGLEPNPPELPLFS
jgi:hypothetical protein